MSQFLFVWCYQWSPHTHKWASHVHVLVFESQMQDQTDPDDCGSFEIGAHVDPRQELQAILKNGGGLKLGYRLMKEALHRHVCIMSVVENACWDWYTEEIKSTKSPKDHLKRICVLTGDGWAAEPHLFATFRKTLSELESLQDMQIPMGDSEMATRALALAWTLVGKRAWTMAKYSCPPECYANLLTDDRPDLAAEAAALMRGHHRNVLSLEQAKHSIQDAKDVWDSCLYLNMQPIRLLWEYYRRDKYSPMSPDGKHLLLGLSKTLADNKIVEDIHAPLRLASKGNSNDKLSPQTVQDVINHSNVMETREIDHRSVVSKEEFVAEEKKTKIKRHGLHRCARHKLPPEYSRILRPGPSFHRFDMT